MKKLILTTSVIALSLTGLAHANSQTNASVAVSTDTTAETSGLRGALDRAIDKTTSVIDKTTNKVESKYHDMKVSVMDRENNFTEQNLNSEYTAKKLIGKTIINANGDRVGTLDDIIVSANGNVQSAVVANGDFAGIGKKAAFDFGSVVSQQADGKVVTSISENDIKQARKFDAIPSGSYSVKELLDADVETANKALDADLENITFKGSKAEYLVLKADNDKVDGADSYAAVDFSKVKLMPQKDNEVDIQLTAAQEQSLLAHISTAAQ